MFVCCECCVFSGRGLCDELITRPEESYRMWCVVVCDLETSWMRRRRVAKPQKKKNEDMQHRTWSTWICICYVCILMCSICSALTLILLTWRMWWANNASKWKMGFNSAFKVLIWFMMYK
jgi:ABC-type Fe3+ transport system permease subunit